MKTITLYEPWASWIAAGCKTIETRTHDRFRCLVGSRIAIHAGRAYDHCARAEARRVLAAAGQPVPRAQCRLGQVVCTVEVFDARWLRAADSVAAMCDCRPDPESGFQRFGIFLRDPIAIEGPSVRGRQGIWNWTPAEQCPCRGDRRSP